jgi:hypothetical protein
MDNLSSIDKSNYLVADSRLGWQVNESVRFDVVGQHLFDSHHPEFDANIIEVQSIGVEQSVYAQLTIQF